MSRWKLGLREPPRNDKTLPCGSRHAELRREARWRSFRGERDHHRVSDGASRELRYVVRDDLAFDALHSRTPDGWITYGFSEDLLDEAATKH